MTGATSETGPRFRGSVSVPDDVAEELYGLYKASVRFIEAMLLGEALRLRALHSQNLIY